ncbi:hypothetical protein [Bradyrhizobium sp. Ash2021]|uniref:hypothetical protein n=1 Tax=Bradyrhizobium sp. Ash2021 TaxID=2954771 RepID=UPI0028165ACE|nr:hypothetical protein [Bradyrhizobium sp. Ash2021]WMT73339.1 hypothetical protein NL528_36085 [Bradyrhizobium sp. Ash2021]
MTFATEQEALDLIPHSAARHGTSKFNMEVVEDGEVRVCTTERKLCDLKTGDYIYDASAIFRLGERTATFDPEVGEEITRFKTEHICGDYFYVDHLRDTFEVFGGPGSRHDYVAPEHVAALTTEGS